MINFRMFCSFGSAVYHQCDDEGECCNPPLQQWSYANDLVRMAYQTLLPPADRAAPPLSRGAHVLLAAGALHLDALFSSLFFVSVFVSLSCPFFPSPSVFFPFFQENSHRGRRCLGNAVCLQNLGLKPLDLREPLCPLGEWPGLFETNFHRFNSLEPRFPERNTPSCWFQQIVWISNSVTKWIFYTFELKKMWKSYSYTPFCAVGSRYRGYLMHFGELNR